MKIIQPIMLQVALKSSDKAHTFKFSTSLTVPRTVIHVTAGQMALRNVKFLVADTELTNEDLLVGHPVLAHLGIDSKTMIEKSLDRLDGTDCSDLMSKCMDTPSVGRLLNAHIQGMCGGPIKPPQVPNQISSARPREKYFACRSSVDPFPDSYLLEIEDLDERNDVLEVVDKMLEKAASEGLPEKHMSEMRKLVNEFINLFRTTFPTGPPSNLPPLKFEIKPDSSLIQVKLRKYSDSQRTFLKRLTDKLLEKDLIYRNPTFKWCCAPHLVRKPGPEEWRFTCLLYTSPSPRDQRGSRMPSSA